MATKLNRIVLLIFSLSILSLSAQELTEKDFPNSGSNGLFRSFTKESILNPEPQSGKNQKWDYSSVPSSQALQSVLWLPIENAKEAQKKIFTNATYFIQDKTSDTPIYFYTSEKSSHKYLGFTFNGQNYKFATPVDYYKYPMSFDESLISEFQYEDKELGSGIISVTYDATGSISIPQLEYDDVFRLKVETKSVFPDTPNDTIVSKEYHYFERGTGQLILRIYDLGPSPVKGEIFASYIYFVEPITSVSPELTLNTIAYPNPTQSELRLIIPKHTIVNYEIYNQLGAVVGSGDYNDFINVKSLNSGSYFIKAELENSQYIMKKFIKE